VACATPYALRHGLASRMAEHGVTPAQIAAQLGHAEGGVLALRTYVNAEITDAPDFMTTRSSSLGNRSTRGSTRQSNRSERDRAAAARYHAARVRPAAA